MLRFVLLLVLGTHAFSVSCQRLVSGKVTEMYSGKSIQGAKVSMPSKNVTLITDSLGVFMVEGDRDTILIEHKEFETVKVRIPASGPLSVSLRKAHAEGDIYTVVQHPAYFPGGMNAFSKYLNENLVFPEEAKKAGIMGRVFVEFVIDTTGSVMPNEVKVIKSLDPACDKEAIRLIKSSPKWFSAITREKRVRQKMMFPVIFKP